MMKVRPYALLGNALLARIERQVELVASTWSADWGFEPENVVVSSQRAWEESSREEAWQQCYQQGEGCAWLSLSPEFLKAVQRQIFPADLRHAFQAGDTAPIATDGAKKAVAALADAIAQAFGFSSSLLNIDNDRKPAQELFEFASGAILVVLKIGEQSIKSLLNYAGVEAQHRPVDSKPLARLPRVDLTKALSNAPISLKVSAGQVEVGVGNFMTLALGDVIRLPISIDKPLTVLGPDNGVLFGAHLGKQSQSMAIEVVPYKK